MSTHNLYILRILEIRKQGWMSKISDLSTQPPAPMMPIITSNLILIIFLWSGHLLLLTSYFMVWIYLSFIPPYVFLCMKCIDFFWVKSIIATQEVIRLKILPILETYLYVQITPIFPLSFCHLIWFIFLSSFILINFFMYQVCHPLNTIYSNL